MQNDHSNLDITFLMDSVRFHVSYIMYGCAYQIVQSHSHGNGCYEIHYISSGKGSAVIDGISYELCPGVVYVTGPHVEHSQLSSKENPLWEYCIYFYISQEDQERSHSVLTETFLENKFWFGQDSQNVCLTMEQLFAEFENRYLGYQQHIELLLKQLVIKLVRSYGKNTAAKEQYAPSNLQERSTRMIEEHFLFRYRDSSLEKLASELGLSSRQTQRLIQKQYGKTYVQKRTEARMSMAAVFLTETDFSVGEISVKLGFATTEHFSNTFRRYYGLSATGYRTQHRKQLE